MRKEIVDTPVEEELNYILLLGIFTLSTIFDVATTVIGIQQFGAVELNVIVQEITKHFGYEGVFVVKVMLILGTITTFEYLRRTKLDGEIPPILNNTLRVIAFAALFYPAWNAYQLGTVLLR